MKRRREFIMLLGGAVMWPLAARAQQAVKLPTIGYLGSGTPTTQGQWTAAFVHRLHDLGWIEDRTVAMEYRWAEGRNERYSAIAAEFVQRKVDVIVALGGAIFAAKEATSVIPRTRLAAASSHRSRGRAATSPACRSRSPISLASESNSCARLSRVCTGWRSWSM
jgi:hypothetical protein